MTVEPFAWSKTSGLGYQKASSVVFSHDGQTFYMGSPTKPTGLFAVSAITGQVVWSYATTGNVYGEGPAVGSDGTIYFSDEGGTFYAISPSGSLKWQHNVGKGQNASPAVTSDGTVYVIASGPLTGLQEALSWMQRERSMQEQIQEFGLIPKAGRKNGNLQRLTL